MEPNKTEDEKREDDSEMKDDHHLKLGINIAGIKEVMAMINFPVSLEEMMKGSPLASPASPASPGYKRQASWIAGLAPHRLCGYDLAEAIRMWLKETGQEQFSMCEILQKNKSQHVGLATVFYSHLQAEPINQLVTTIERSLRHFGLAPDTMVWVDFFDLRQCQPNAFNVDLIQTLIAHIGQTICEIDAARTYFNSIWCLFEVGATIQGEGKLLPYVGAQFSPAEADEVLDRVDSKSAQARKQKDKDAIDKFIKAELWGHQEFDRKLRAALRESIKIDAA
jgi:hypothetical protein